MALPISVSKSVRTSEMCGSQRPCSLETTEERGPFVKSWVLCFLSWVETLWVAKLLCCYDPWLVFSYAAKAPSSGCMVLEFGEIQRLKPDTRGLEWDRRLTHYCSCFLGDSRGQLGLRPVPFSPCLFSLDHIWQNKAKNWNQIQPKRMAGKWAPWKTSEDFLQTERQMYSIYPDKQISMLTSQMGIEAMQN